MGISFALSTAQHLAEYTATLLRERFPDTDFDIILWIDNVILLTNNTEDDKILRAAYDDILFHLGIVAKEWECGTSLEALGMDIDLTNSTIKPAQKSLLKIQEVLSEVEKEPSCRNFYKFTVRSCGSATSLLFRSPSSPTS